MRYVYSIVLISSIFFALYAQAPTFENPVYIYEGASIIDVGWYGAPVAYDWDGDSKKDLLVGQFTQGRIRFYKNTGEHANPVFDNSLYLQADAADIVLPYG